MITGENLVYCSRAEVFYILNSGVISLSLRSAVDEQMNGNLDLSSTLVARSSMLQQNDFAPVATSDLSVCITVLSLSLTLSLSLSLYHTHPVAYVLLHYTL